MGRVIAIANQKGGVAKTTSVHALGVALAEVGKRVLLVDLDPQASLTWSLGIDPDELELSLHDVMVGRAKAAEVIVEAGPVELMPATIDLAGAEVHLLSRTGREYQLRRALEKVKDSYGFVLVDCAPSLGILTINGLTAADQVIIPVQCETLSRRGVGQLLETIEDVRTYTNEDLEVLGVIATMFDGRTKLANEVLESIPVDYKVPVLGQPVPKSVKVAEAPGAGRSILEHASTSKPAAAYRAIAAEVAKKR